MSYKIFLKVFSAVIQILLRCNLFLFFHLVTIDYRENKSADTGNFYLLYHKEFRPERLLLGTEKLIVEGKNISEPPTTPNNAELKVQKSNQRTYRRSMLPLVIKTRSTQLKQKKKINLATKKIMINAYILSCLERDKKRMK